MPQRHARSVQLFILEDQAVVYTLAANITADITYSLMRETVDLADEHRVDLMRRVTDPMLKAPVLTFTGNLDQQDGSHDAITGIQKLMFDGTQTSIQVRGPDFVAPNDEMTEISGFWVVFDAVGPASSVYNFSSGFAPDGSLYNVNGVALSVA